MKFSNYLVAVCCAASAQAAFVSNPTVAHRPSVAVNGYLDDLSADLYKEDDTPDVEGDKREANQMSKDQIDRYGPGNLNDYVDFEEFDGGDGQMGVAGDGSTGLDKSDFESGTFAKNMNKSRSRSARNAWGSSGSGYAEELVKKGVDTARAQQLENWANQQEITRQKNDQRRMTETFDSQNESAEADWRTLASFGVERNQEFDMNAAFGAATPEGAEDMGVLELNAGGAGYALAEISLKNPFMGFADFRAMFVDGTGPAFSIDPSEGSLAKEPINFNVRFKPDRMGVQETYLVIETEDFKKAWKCIATT